ncbi:hypothetical protein PR202_gb24807 [Eleusine coracana subsp. coracana]|uniref:RNA-directed DNA polymerase, eukaryota, reverse transcriptase zinc-binding domain protein n=1 Tax=Eleusine coracana subsp. coracana TaxID=191504 RepID=A0AAV5FNH3_ELECO|nr:hypothetical protein PR202_gb24807 [Eleusine coracana subsp. coracana]
MDAIQDENLTSAPSKEGIFNILKNIRGNAAPGPDGFNVTFYRMAWSWIGDDVFNLVRNFYLNKCIAKSMKKANIVLISKKQICSLSLDYRPISLCNVS